jgi:hypothetical protein
MAVLLVGTQSVIAAQYSLDDFTETSLGTQLTANSGTTTASAADGDSLSSVLGGERDLLLFYESGSNNVNLNVDTVEDNLAFSAQTNTDGRFSATWDGEDNNASSNAYDLNADLTSGGSNDSFVISVTSDGNFDLTLTVCNDSVTCGAYTVNETDDIQGIGRVYWIPFTDFSGSVDFGNDVDVVVLDVNPETEVDFSIDFIETRGSGEALADFGDLPDSYNITLKADNGAGHWNPGASIELYNTESAVDAEADGQESANASGDGTDEGGVVRTGLWTSSGQVDVYVLGGRGCLMGWLDWNDDSSTGPNDSFDNSGELIIDNEPVDGDSNPNQFTFGGFGFNLADLTVYARFRIVPDLDADGDCTDQAAVSYTGFVDDGEVEDYEWSFGPNAVTLSGVATSPLAMAPVALGVVALGAVIVVRRRRRDR